MKRAYEGTRNICSKIGCKIKNAVDEFWMEGNKNQFFGIVNDESAERLEIFADKLEELAATGWIADSQWEAVKSAIEINNLLAISK